ncbi:MAG: type II CAAX prenyl endopeptidase Rce1 family protein [Candidatus Thorarchaeota archaeon]
MKHLLQKEDLLREILVIICFLQLLRELLIVILPIEVNIVNIYSPVYLIIGGPISEELLFRLVTMGWIGRGNGYPSVTDTNNSLSRIVQTIFIVTGSVIFGYVHTFTYGEASFSYYMTGGIIYGILFFRYGFVMCLGWHMLNNLTSFIEMEMISFPPVFSVFRIALIGFYVFIVERRKGFISDLFQKLKQQRPFLVAFLLIFSILGTIFVDLGYSLFMITLIFSLALIDSLEVISWNSAHRIINHIKRDDRGNHLSKQGK